MSRQRSVPCRRVFAWVLATGLVSADTLALQRIVPARQTADAEVLVEAMKIKGRRVIAGFKTYRKAYHDAVRVHARARGWSATEFAVVEAIQLPATRSRPVAEGQVLAWSWDDGDDTTWEGVLQFEYPDGTRVALAAQSRSAFRDYGGCRPNRSWSRRDASDGRTE